MKKEVLILFLLINFFSFSQNKQVLYDFAELPQTLLLNPGAEVNYKSHLGLPLLSGLSLDFGSTEFVVSDIFAVDNLSFNDKVNSLLLRLNTRDHIKLNSQIEVLSAGFSFDEKNYITVGFYQELDAIGYFPKDLIILASQGNNAFLNKSFNASQILYKVDFLGVLHAGISRKINKNLSLGGRFKIYSSALNLESTNNTGTFTTSAGTNNIYRHALQNINVNFRTSGLIRDNEYIQDATTYLNNTFLGSNLGIGIDVGFTYKVSSQLEVSGSLLDIGFINHTKNIKNTVVEGGFIFEGIDLLYNSQNANYWNDLNEQFIQELPTTDNQESYISWRPAKLNAALKYSFGEIRSKYCYDDRYKDFYTDAFGVQLFSIFRPLTQQLALTGFYQKSFSDKLHAKITYTVDDYSYTNIGIGLSAQIWKVNFYGMLDNLAGLSDISSANNTSIQFGFNLIFN